MAGAQEYPASTTATRRPMSEVCLGGRFASGIESRSHIMSACRAALIVVGLLVIAPKECYRQASEQAGRRASADPVGEESSRAEKQTEAISARFGSSLVRATRLLDCSRIKCSLGWVVEADKSKDVACWGCGKQVPCGCVRTPAFCLLVYLSACVFR